MGLVAPVIFILVLFQPSYGQESPIYKWALKVTSQTCSANNNLPPLTQSDAAGNVYILGSFCQPFDANPGSGTYTLTADNNSYDDNFLIKLDPNGSFLWATRFADNGYSNFHSALVVDASGNAFTATYFELGFQDFRTIIHKFDASGNVVWSDRIYTAKGRAFDIILDDSGNPILTGSFSDTADFDPGTGIHSATASGSEIDYFVLKLDTDGNFLWVKTAGGVNIETGVSIARDASGNIVVAGYYMGTTDLDPSATASNFTSVGSTDVFVLKLDASGNFLWGKSMGATQSDLPTGIAVNTSNNIFITGYFSGSGDFDPNAGITTLTSTTANSDIFIMRLNADGSFGWASGFGGNDTDEGRALTTDTNGNIIFTGFFNGTVDFDPGAGTRNLVSIGQNGYQNLFIAKLNEDQQLVWAQEIASTTSTSSTTLGYTISIDAAGDISIGGRLWGGTDFDFGVCDRSLGNNPPVGFVMKIKTGATPGQPTITSFTPTSGGAGTSVVITGTNFSTIPSENDVRFNPYILAVVTASTPTSITATVPSGATSGNIYVTVGCYPVAISQSNFTVGVSVLPTITSFTPTAGVVGTTVTITGTNFSTTPANNTVRFNGTTATVTASTATTITTSVPSGATTGKITVTIGANTATSATDFTVTSVLPSITSFTPSSGPVGNAVTITGTNFSTTAANNTVRFNGTTASVTTSTATSITTSVPSGASTGKITVTVGANTATSVADFTVTIPVPPTITSFTPSSGPIGNIVTITGTNFSTMPANNTVRFNGTTASVMASTATSITTSVPSGATTGKITVTVGVNTASSVADFTVTIVPSPTIISFTPIRGPIGNVVTITGTNFSPMSANNTVTFNGTTTSVSASTATSITTTVPIGATTGKITVTVGGNTATSINDFVITTPGGAVTITTETLGASVGGTINKDLIPLITTLNTNLDINSIAVVTQPPSGAFASISNGMLTVDYKNIAFSGRESITIRACDTDGNCTTQPFEIEIAGDVIVYNALSPDGKNPVFRLAYIDLFTDTQKNTVYIYNRWGDEVFVIKDYDNVIRVFSGLSSSGEKLPSGTYFYKVLFVSERKTMTGYLELRY